jgi:putative two-component system protein, hydrogenase maturation factor HypX/HoxX
MAQRLWIELDRLNHQVHVQIATSTQAMVEGVENYKPQLIIAPFLTAKIPTEIYENYTCLIVHPGIKGDRGASSLDWAILNQEKAWGVTILRAAKKMDTGAIWAFCEFNMRLVSKGELYRNEVTQAAAQGVIKSLMNFETSNFKPEVLTYSNPSIKGKWNKKTTQAQYAFSWQDNTDSIIRKIRAADSSPGVLVTLFGKEFYCYGAHLESYLKGKPGEILAHRNDAICIATTDAAIWLTHLKSSENKSIKLPSIIALDDLAKPIPPSDLSAFENVDGSTWQEIRFEQEGNIGYLYFNFYNGAMRTSQCHRLQSAFVEAKKKVKLIVLMGGQDVWSNGIHLNLIEHAKNSADESWLNINALNNLIQEIILSTHHYIICALQGNAGAGGVSLALSGDKVLARDGIVLNPHTRNMGLFGSEYWTYLLPNRIGISKANRFTEECLPWGVAVAKEIGLIDAYHGQSNVEFISFVRHQAEGIVKLSYFDKLLKAKQAKRRKDEMNKPLENYRNDELVMMKANFYDNDMDYNNKRHCFVHKIPNENLNEMTDLYSSRRTIYRKRKWESIQYKEKQ